MTTADDDQRARWGEPPLVDTCMYPHATMAALRATAERDEWALKAQQAKMDRDEQALRADTAESRAARAEAALRNVEEETTDYTARDIARAYFAEGGR